LSLSVPPAHLTSFKFIEREQQKAGREVFATGSRKLLLRLALDHIPFTPPKLRPIASWTTGATEATTAVMVPGVVHNFSRLPELSQVLETVSSKGRIGSDLTESRKKKTGKPVAK
jgi:hypothetical protein